MLNNEQSAGTIAEQGTNADDMHVSPAIGNTDVVGSTGKSEERFKVILEDYKKEYLRVHEKEDDSDWVYKSGYIRNSKNKYSTPYRIADFEKWLSNIKNRLSNADQKIFDKKKRYVELGEEIIELSKEIERKSEYRDELKKELEL